MLFTGEATAIWKHYLVWRPKNINIFQSSSAVSKRLFVMDLVEAASQKSWIEPRIEPNFHRFHLLATEEAPDDGGKLLDQV